MAAKAENPHVVIYEQGAIFSEKHCDSRVRVLRRRRNGAVRKSQGAVVIIPHFVAKLLGFDPIVDSLEVASSDANYVYAEGIKFGFEVAEPATFDGSPIRPCGWKEPKDRRVTLKVGWASRLPIRIRCRESRQLGRDARHVSDQV